MFDAVHPGYHVNKTHWNAMLLDGSIPRGEVERVIERSDARVVKRLREVERVALDVRHGKGALYR
jgi:predicted DNA-binding protein (MmcQ/YjbR family)